MRRKTVAALAAVIVWPLITAASCATTGEPGVRVVEKAVPTPVPCVSDTTPRPGAYPDTDDALKAAVSAAARYGLMAAGRILRDQRLAEVEPVIEACRKPPT